MKTRKGIFGILYLTRTNVSNTPPLPSELRVAGVCQTFVFCRHRSCREYPVKCSGESVFQEVDICCCWLFILKNKNKFYSENSTINSKKICQQILRNKFYRHKKMQHKSNRNANTTGTALVAENTPKTAYNAYKILKTLVFIDHVRFLPPTKPPTSRLQRLHYLHGFIHHEEMSWEIPNRIQ